MFTMTKESENRAVALAWWSLLSLDEQKKIATKYKLLTAYELITADAREIQSMWETENNYRDNQRVI